MGGSEYHSSGDDYSDISGSEMADYAEISYTELKNGNLKVETSENTFSCPYCSPRKRKRDFLYQDILLHASGFSSCCSLKQSIKDKANHLALEKYLKTDISVCCNATDHKASVEVVDETFVWPWIGIVVNIHTELVNGRLTGLSGSKLKDELTARGFNPTRVKVQYNDMGHSGTALVEFDPSWSGFANAKSFEYAYAGDHHGREDWKVDNGQKTGLYGWLAREDDYNSDNMIGEYLRKTRNVRKLSEILFEENRKANILVESLADALDTKNFQLQKMEKKVKKIEISWARVFAEHDKLCHSYNEELENTRSTAQELLQKILDDHEKLKFKVETEKKELELRGKELEQRDARNQSERKKLLEEVQKMACHLKPVAASRHDAPVVGQSHALSDESDAYLVDHEGTSGAVPQPHTTIQHTTMAPQIPDMVDHSEPTLETSDPIFD